MPSRDFVSVLAIAYLLPYCAIAGALLLVGATLDRLAVVPSAVSRRFDRVLIAAVVTLALPADAWPAPEAESGGDTTD